MARFECMCNGNGEYHVSVNPTMDSRITQPARGSIKIGLAVWPSDIEFQILYFQIIVYKKLAIPLLELYKTQSTEVVVAR